MTRRVQKIRRVGTGVGIVLPAEWLSRNGLEPGSWVVLEMTEQKISVFPGEEEGEIEVDAKYAKHVERFLRRNKNTLERLTR